MSTEETEEYEQAGYNQCRSVRTRTRRGEPVDSLTYMQQNFRTAKRPPEDPVGGTIRDLKEHYEDCETAPVKMHPKAPSSLPLFPPGDPRNNPKKKSEGWTQHAPDFAELKPEAA